MNTAGQPSNEPRVRRVEVTADLITAHLADGRTISVPLAWSWRLSDARPDQRVRYEIIGDGTGIHWPDVDEHISVRGMLEGSPAHGPARRKQSVRGRAYRRHQLERDKRLVHEK